MEFERLIHEDDYFYEGEDPNITQVDVQSFTMAERVSRVVPPIMLVVGTFGNVMTILVLRAAGVRFGCPSTRLFFLGLAVCDQVVLGFGLTRKWVIALVGYDIRTAHMSVCKVHKLLVHTVSRMAAWILVAVTSQRVIAIMWPLRYKSCTARRVAVMVMAVIMVLCVMVDSRVMLVYTLKTINGTSNCGVDVHGRPALAFYQHDVVPWLNSITGSLLPSFVLLVNNAVLGYNLCAASSNNVRERKVSRAISPKKAISLSLTIFVTSLSFLLLTSPIPIRFVLEHVRKNSSQHAHKEDLSHVILDMVLYFNNAVNFYLYVLTNSTHRQVVKGLLMERRFGHDVTPPYYPTEKSRNVPETTGPLHVTMRVTSQSSSSMYSLKSNKDSVLITQNQNIDSPKPQNWQNSPENSDHVSTCRVDLTEATAVSTHDRIDSSNVDITEATAVSTHDRTDSSNVDLTEATSVSTHDRIASSNVDIIEVRASSTHDIITSNDTVPFYQLALFPLFPLTKTVTKTLSTRDRIAFSDAHLAKNTAISTQD